VVVDVPGLGEVKSVAWVSHAAFSRTLSFDLLPLRSDLIALQQTLLELAPCLLNSSQMKCVSGVCMFLKTNR
jgi:hypothetical protein